MPQSPTRKTFSARFAPFLPAGLLLAFCLALAGCAGGQVAPTRVNTVPPYGACLARCNEMMDRSTFVRDGCRRGCELALEDFSLRGAQYLTREACNDAVERVNHSLEMNRLQERCEDTWDGEERREGCQEAGLAFYNAINANMCLSAMP